jgi:mono/diheme cytochrome c family protein
MRFMTQPTILSGMVLVLAGLSPVVAPASDDDEFFETRIRPLLSANCFACHTDSQLGGLRLDSRDSLLKGGKSGPAVVPGNPERSLLILAVKQTDERLKMPMGGTKLKADEINDLTSWVKMGAPWPQKNPSQVARSVSQRFVIGPEQRTFWSFQPIQKTPLPKVKTDTWARSVIDRFILAHLESRGLAPAKEASRQVLIRRASLDLIGLPPTMEEVESFLADSSSDAFARVVDRLLASPHYGERWGRYWLDVARYGEDDVRGAVPDGFEPYANAFRYRDWVIQAFNNDMPYDLFLKAQIAGDLLKVKDHERLLPGLGFFGFGPWYYDLFEATQARANERHDRVDVVTRGFLGLTVGCARCHDHKYDPISMQDYYALAGVFASSEYQEFPLVPDAQVESYRKQEKKVKDQETSMKEFLDSKSRQLGEILAGQASRYLLAAWRVLGPPKEKSEKVARDQNLDTEVLERWTTYLGSPQKDHPYLKKWADLLSREGTAGEAKQVADEFQGVVLATLAEKKEVDAHNQSLFAEARSKRGAPKGFLPNQFALYDGDTDNCFGISLVVKSVDRDKFMLWTDLFAERAQSGDSSKKEPGVLQFKDEKLDRFLSGEWRKYIETARAELQLLKKDLPGHYPYLQIIGESKEPANLKLHLRGNPHNLGDEVPRRFLTVLSKPGDNSFQQGSGRLELAEAIASHPLAARVMANRIWLHHFDRGIVGTPSNFGTLGERPSHPELLEYLAGRFVESGYSMKALHREIMLSATYRSASDFSQVSFVEDPDNQLLWRASPRRLDAEAIRDSLLFVSGNLDTAAGGTSSELNDSNYRRSVYGKISRFKMDAVLSLFDFPDPSITNEQRNATNVPLQGLFFLNSGLVSQQAERFAKRLIEEEALRDDGARIRKAYRILYSREATKEEVEAGLEFLKSDPAELGGKLKVWRQYSQVLLSANEFVFVK